MKKNWYLFADNYSVKNIFEKQSLFSKENFICVFLRKFLRISTQIFFCQIFYFNKMKNKMHSAINTLRLFVYCAVKTNP